MTKQKSKKAKLEKPRAWDEAEEKFNPGSVSAMVSSSQDEYEPNAPSQAQSLTKNSFAAEVKAMLYAYGDVRHPLAETASLVEEIVHTQMCELLKAAAGVAEMRSSTELGLEEFLFLLRKDPGKLTRFVNRMKFLDSHTKFVAGSSTDIKTEPFQEGEEHEEIEQAATESKSYKRFSLCIDFLSFIDETGELTSNVIKYYHDEIKMKRLERAERQTRDMSSNEYMEYVKCRQITFASQQGSAVARKLQRERFRDWFDFESLGIEIPISRFGWDAMEYLAQETVAELVDLSLLVRSETMPPLLPCESEPDSRHLPLYASSSFVARAEILRAKSTDTEASDGSQEGATKRKKANKGLNRKLALKPSHITEAMRRFISNPTKTFLSKATSVSISQTLSKLLCLPQ